MFLVPVAPKVLAHVFLPLPVTWSQSRCFSFGSAPEDLNIPLKFKMFSKRRHETPTRPPWTSACECEGRLDVTRPHRDRPVATEFYLLQ